MEVSDSEGRLERRRPLSSVHLDSTSRDWVEFGGDVAGSYLSYVRIAAKYFGSSAERLNIRLYLGRGSEFDIKASLTLRSPSDRFVPYPATTTS